MRYSIVATLNGEKFILDTGLEAEELPSLIAEYVQNDKESGSYGTFQIIPEGETE
ncbi:hypothetical protein [Bacillus pseudomycoides]|uniref:hypothetical protein n=1 Tax=Bacillus pseudomycoides TaxID=64104 RepID=UPI00159B9A3F|nr:hypothetical protein [Bacillus pseudomycoides]